MKNLFVVASILLVTLLAYGQTINMYFWQDDYAAVFKVQHIEGGAGNFGTGIYDRGSSYRFVATLLYPVYLLFGNQAWGYYLAGIIFYFLAGCCVYFMIKALTHKKEVALMGALIFAGGYVGAESIIRVATATHTSHMIGAQSLAIGFYALYCRKKHRRWLYYFLSLILFAYTLETGFIRAHGLILVIAAAEVLLQFHIIRSIFRLLPFAFIYTRIYADGRLSEWFGFFKVKVIDEGNHSILLSPFKTLQNLLVPDQFKLSFVIFVIVLLVFLYKRKKARALLLLGLAMAFAPIIVPFVTNRAEVFGSMHRYVTASSPGVALFFAVLLSDSIKSLKKYYIAGLVIVGIQLVLLNREHWTIINTRSLDSKAFYKSLLTYVPSLPKNSLVFFDHAQDAVSTNHMGQFLAVGSMPVTTSIAVHYGVDRYDLIIPDSFEEMLSIISQKENEIDKNNIFTFFYDAKVGLQNTTASTQEALFVKQEQIAISDPQKVNLNVAVPFEISGQVKAKIDEKQIKFNSQQTKDFPLYLNYLQAKNRYYTAVSAETYSEEKYHWKAYMFDKDPSTAWMGNRLNWHYEKKEEIILDLGKLEKVAAVKMSHISKNLVPMQYSYSCSVNKTSWNNLGEFSYYPNKDVGTVLNIFSSPQDCRFIKLNVLKTLGDDAPQIAELEVISSGFENLKGELAIEIEKNPFNYLHNESDYSALKNYFQVNGMPLDLCLENNKSATPYCEKIPVKNGVLTNYSVFFLPKGTKITSIKIQGTKEVEVSTVSMQIRTLSYDELKRRGMITKF